MSSKTKRVDVRAAYGVPILISESSALTEALKNGWSIRSIVVTDMLKAKSVLEQPDVAGKALEAKDLPYAMITFELEKS